MSKKQNIYVSDLPLGVLIFLLGVMLYYAAWVITGVTLGEFVGVLLTLWLARFITRIGAMLVKGLNVDLS